MAMRWHCPLPCLQVALSEQQEDKMVSFEDFAASKWSLLWILECLWCGSQFPLRDYKIPPHPEQPGKLVTHHNLAHPGTVLIISENLLKIY